MARVALLFLAAVFLCVGTAFLGLGLYAALLLAMAPWAAGLLTGLIALIIAGLFAIVGAHWNSGAPLAGTGLNAAAASISRAVDTNPLVAVAAATAVGVIQSLLSGRRK